MHITLKQVLVFDAIARLGSVSRAAEAISLSQSAASMALREFESALGVPLFERRGKQLVLNEYGRRLQTKARALLVQADEIEATRLGEGLHGPLRVGASPAAGGYVLPRLVTAFTRGNPGVFVSVKIGNSAEIAAQMRNLALDLAVIEVPMHWPQLVRHPWRRDGLVIIAAPDHPLAGGVEVAPEALRDQTWIMGERFMEARTVFLLRAEPVLGNITVAMELGSIEAVKCAVAAGAGIGCLPRATVQAELGAGTLAELRARGLDLNLGYNYDLLSVRGPDMRAAAAAFLDFLRAHAD
ncbi:MAG: LysR substrate-binding domain-containing protein [Gammaproteobacteria bacterium]